MLQAVGYAQGSRSVDKMPVGDRHEVRRESRADTEMRFPEGHPECAVWNDARRCGHLRIIVYGIAERSARKNRGNVYVERGAVEKRQACRVRAQSADGIRIGWNINTADGEGASTGRIPVKILGGSGECKKCAHYEQQGKVSAEPHPGVTPFF